jgi:hypothetical protein
VIKRVNNSGNIIKLLVGFDQAGDSRNGFLSFMNIFNLFNEVIVVVAFV